MRYRNIVPLLVVLCLGNVVYGDRDQDDDDHTDVKVYMQKGTTWDEIEDWSFDETQELELNTLFDTNFKILARTHRRGLYLEIEAKDPDNQPAIEVWYRAHEDFEDFSSPWRHWEEHGHRWSRHYHLPCNTIESTLYFKVSRSVPFGAGQKIKVKNSLHRDCPRDFNSVFNWNPYVFHDVNLYFQEPYSLIIDPGKIRLMGYLQGRGLFSFKYETSPHKKIDFFLVDEENYQKMRIPGSTDVDAIDGSLSDDVELIRPFSGGGVNGEWRDIRNFDPSTNYYLILDNRDGGPGDVDSSTDPILVKYWGSFLGHDDCPWAINSEFAPRGCDNDPSMTIFIRSVSVQIPASSTGYPSITCGFPSSITHAEPMFRELAHAPLRQYVHYVMYRNIIQWKVSYGKTMRCMFIDNQDASGQGSLTIQEVDGFRLKLPSHYSTYLTKDFDFDSFTVYEPVHGDTRDTSSFYLTAFASTFNNPPSGKLIRHENVDREFSSEVPVVPNHVCDPEFDPIVIKDVTVPLPKGNARVVDDSKITFTPPADLADDDPRVYRIDYRLEDARGGLSPKQTIELKLAAAGVDPEPIPPEPTPSDPNDGNIHSGDDDNSSTSNNNSNSHARTQHSWWPFLLMSVFMLAAIGSGSFALVAFLRNRRLKNILDSRNRPSPHSAQTVVTANATYVVYDPTMEGEGVDGPLNNVIPGITGATLESSPDLPDYRNPYKHQPLASFDDNEAL